jgi:hypothetical protein
MNTLMKAGIALAVIGGGAVTVHHVARAADPVAAASPGAIAIPAKLEAHIRAMARSHAPAGEADQMEAHVMTLVRAHLAEVAKDPAAAAHVKQVMAAAEAGDEEAIKHVHEALMALAADAHH